MKVYLLMLILIVMLFSGCTQTGELTEKTGYTENNTTESPHGVSDAGTSGPENMPPAGNNPESPGQQGTATEGGPAGGVQAPETNPCSGAVCGESTKTCPDGFISVCSNPCDSGTGECMDCVPDCGGHDAACGLACRTCEILDDEECECDTILFCDGNDICEEGEYPESNDCPDCDDDDLCTQDSYDYGLKSCINESISPCCGDMECGDGENESNCPDDCLEEQYGDVRITALDEKDEWVEIEGYNVVMASWTLSDWKDIHVYTFPDWFMINGKARLNRGYGNDTNTILFWQSNSYVWNNDGDNATLRDGNGDIVDLYNYP
jgi:hypothetical protein